MENNSRFLVDFYNGTTSEINNLPILQKFFNDDTLVRDIDRYAIFDYTNNKNLYIELKTRTCKHNTYNDTMINIIKINKSKKLFKNGNQIYFCFQFIDGLYYWKYNEDDILDYRLGGRSERSFKYNEKKQYTYISISLLKKINI